MLFRFFNVHNTQWQKVEYRHMQIRKNAYISVAMKRTSKNHFSEVVGGPITENTNKEEFFSNAHPNLEKN